MSRVKGNVASLAKFSRDLQRLPRVVAQKVASEAAPELTKLAKETFARGENAYGDTWAPSVDGEKVTLRQSGDLEKKVYYVAIGTKLRVALGVPHAKYQIGKRPVFPRQGSKLPLAYVGKLDEVTQRVCREELG